MTLRVGLAALLIAEASASAEPFHSHAERCASFDAIALDLAVDRELALDPKLATVARRLSVIVECPDRLHVVVRIEPDPRTGPLTRELDLSDEPAELRIKLAALAIAELIDDVAGDVAGGVAGDAAPRSAELAPAIDTEVPASTVRVADVAKRGPQITMRAGIRMFADDQAPMPTISAELEAGPVEIGLASAIGSDNRVAGIPYVFAVTLSRRVVCSRGRTSLCLIARGEGGFSGVSIHADATTMDHSVHAGYGALSLGFEVARQFHGWKGLASLDLGGADGVVFEDRYLEHLDGPFVATEVGVTW